VRASAALDSPAGAAALEPAPAIAELIGSDDPETALLVTTDREGRDYSATAAAKLSTTAMFCSNSFGKPCRSCKYVGLL
jgi:hypothetical protein